MRQRLALHYLVNQTSFTLALATSLLLLAAGSYLRLQGCDFLTEALPFAELRIKALVKTAKVARDTTAPQAART